MSGAASTELNIAIVAEKPSVARDIARVVGAGVKGDGYLHGGGYVVTWAIGHLVHLAQPNEIRPEWKSWRRETLPMLPRDWPLVVYDKTSEQFETVRKILNSPRIGKVVCATDAGREGELIFRYIYEAAQCGKPVERLWISSLTPDAIRRGLDTMKPGTSYDPLADAARGRSRADWLVGMNLSRAYTLALGEDFSVGRVQTPTLAILVERELEIRAFVPEDYIEVVATFSPDSAKTRYDGTWFRHEGKDAGAPRDSMRLPPDGVEAAQIVERARTGKAAIESVKGETQRMAPPFLYDLTELQRHANRLFGFSAQKTLEVAQSLYERHKLLSYPRTDSRHLSTDVAKTLPGVVAAVKGPYQDKLAPGAGVDPLGKRYVDDTKVTDHHAIIPTATRSSLEGLNSEERRIYDLVCRRLLQAWHDEHIWRVTTIITAISNAGVLDKYLSSGTAIEQLGWKILDLAPEKKPKKTTAGSKGDGEDESKALPAGLREGQPQQVLDVEPVSKKTRPPKRFTEATLLTAMESAGKTLDDKELSDAMKECGLGTPATRAAIIEVLLTRTYIERQGKSLLATDKGVHLIEVVHPEVKSPAMTGQWEAVLQRIHRGKAELTPFIEGIEEYVADVVGKVFTNAPAAVASAPRTAAAAAVAAPARQPLPPKVDSSGKPIEDILHERFGFTQFRPGQEAVCRAIVAGLDGLVVMPTGAGKSLCYQIPGLARGGVTLVVSPLIALMEDQVAKLRANGLRAERIHSGLGRAASRQVCIDYLQGNLDFLFIAPERFRVPGFPEMLSKRKPALIAIDEAHCISQWGHDFRPDYRRIGPYLASFRPAPILALTATATPRVQSDIYEQLGLHGQRFIQGFRRDNLAIEVVEVAPSRRGDLAAELLAHEGRLPAIVYTPSRKEAESVASLLSGKRFRAAAYHAGLDAQRRSDVQARFLGEGLDVIVATIAFGMGIDKANIRTVIHTSTPGSMEAYYQEIGRAGRDGAPSRAILMQSYADRRTHDFFFERDYPEPDALSQIYRRLSEEAQPKDELRLRCKLGEAFDAALEKLWTHGGALVDFEENVTRGEPTWRDGYEAQREQKGAQLEEMLRFADNSQCRMATLVRHFGDLQDGRNNCGICDFCAPDDCLSQIFRAPDASERKLAGRALELLAKGGTLAAGRLHTEVGGETAMPRRDFERVLGGLARAGLVRLEDAVFEKDGKPISFRKVHLTLDGRAEAKSDSVEFTITEIIEAEEGSPSSRGRRKTPVKKGKKKAGSTPSRQTAAAAAASRSNVVKAVARRGEVAPPPVPSADVIAIEKALKVWRLAEAKKQGLPAFRVLTDRTLRAIAEEQPRTTNALLAITGMGLRSVEKYGAAIFRVLSQAR